MLLKNKASRKAATMACDTQFDEDKLSVTVLSNLKWVK
jgi:hypothetical protein